MKIHQQQHQPKLNWQHSTLHRRDDNPPTSAPIQNQPNSTHDPMNLIHNHQHQQFLGQTTNSDNLVTVLIDFSTTWKWTVTYSLATNHYWKHQQPKIHTAAEYEEHPAIPIHIKPNSSTPKPTPALATATLWWLVRFNNSISK